MINWLEMISKRKIVYTWILQITLSAPEISAKGRNILITVFSKLRLPEDVRCQFATEVVLSSKRVYFCLGGFIIDNETNLQSKYLLRVFFPD